jgi:quinohemoprotein ethanol dehydrogenase
LSYLSAEQHYSTLNQINDLNVSNLKLAWYHDIDVLPGTMSAPVEVDGVMYFAAGYSVIQALDARSGKLLWRYDPKAAQVAGTKAREGWGNRGITYGDGEIFTGTIDGRLIAIDAKSGKLLWTDMAVGKNDGRYIIGPPTYFDGKVIMGHGGADFSPVRGYVTAYDARTGKRLWRFYLVPGDPAKGFENRAMAMAAKTWTGEWWKMGGGGTAWNAITFDRQYNRIYVGTGNGTPWNQKIRSPGGGDNLFLCSVVAVDADTGEYVWHYQINPGETWDYDAAMDLELAQIEIEGKLRDVVLTAPKNGFFYVIDRKTGKLISAEKFVKNVNWATRIDKATGRPVENPAARFPNDEEFTVYPSAMGAHSVEAMAYNPRSGLAYLNALDWGMPYVDPAGDLKKWRFAGDGTMSTGIGVTKSGLPAPGNSLLAWDPAKQRVAWNIPLAGMKNGGTMTTAGNLVFQGTTGVELVAYTADTGKRLWAFDAGNGVQAQAITYEVGGTQYVSVISGWVWHQGLGADFSWDYGKQQRRVLTFALNGMASLPPTERTRLPFLDDGAFNVDLLAAGRGATIYATCCQVCHGIGLNAGGGAPDLRKSSVPLSIKGLEAVLTGGTLVSNGMPRFAELKPDEIRALQSYIRRGARIALRSGPAAAVLKNENGALQ